MILQLFLYLSGIFISAGEQQIAVTLSNDFAYIGFLWTKIHNDADPLKKTYS